jgi:hypothetical protein
MPNAPPQVIMMGPDYILQFYPLCYFLVEREFEITIVSKTPNINIVLICLI